MWRSGAPQRRVARAALRGGDAHYALLCEVPPYLTEKGSPGTKQQMEHLDSNHNRSSREAEKATELYPTTRDRYKGWLSVYQR
jgi:hypothetical protein